MTRLLAGKGYDMIGVDNSVDMLEIAMEKKEEEARTSSISFRTCGNLNFTALSGQWCLSVTA